MNRIPFTLPDVGLREVKGMVYIEDGYLVLKIKDALLGLIDEEKDVIKIEPKALEELRVKRRVIQDRLVIEPKKPDLLDLVPGDHPTAVELRIWRKYREQLERLVDAFEALV